MVDVRGDVLQPPHGTTPAAVKANKNHKMSSFKSNLNTSSLFPIRVDNNAKRNKKTRMVENQFIIQYLTVLMILCMKILHHNDNKENFLLSLIIIMF